MNVVAERDEIISEQGEIKILGDFLTWVKSGTKARLKNQTFILEIQEKIEGKDPIIYLYKLYYEKEKSLEEVLKELESLQIKSPSRATLHRLLFIHFGWIPRKNTERTPVHEKQLSTRTEQEVKKFEKQVSTLVGGRKEPRVFKMSEYKEKKYRIGKALYILKTLGGIDKNILYTLSIEGGLSNAVLAKSLNSKIQEILGGTPELGIEFKDVELYPQSIDRWLRNNGNK